MSALWQGTISSVIGRRWHQDVQIDRLRVHLIRLEQVLCMLELLLCLRRVRCLRGFALGSLSQLDGGPRTCDGAQRPGLFAVSRRYSDRRASDLS